MPRVKEATAKPCGLTVFLDILKESVRTDRQPKKKQVDEPVKSSLPGLHQKNSHERATST